VYSPGTGIEIRRKKERGKKGRTVNQSVPSRSKRNEAINKKKEK